MADKELELEFKHHGEMYYIICEFDVDFEDTSFDGHHGGVTHTFKQHSFILNEESLNVISCCDSDGDDRDIESIPGLYSRLVNYLGSLDHSE